jgi:hypothetical protein
MVVGGQGGEQARHLVEIDEVLQPSLKFRLVPGVQQSLHEVAVHAP